MYSTCFVPSARSEAARCPKDLMASGEDVPSGETSVDNYGEGTAPQDIRVMVSDHSSPDDPDPEPPPRAGAGGASLLAPPARRSQPLRAPGSTNVAPNGAATPSAAQPGAEMVEITSAEHLRSTSADYGDAYGDAYGSELMSKTPSTSSIPQPPPPPSPKHSPPPPSPMYVSF